jgi:hypothetical protein
MKRFTIFGYFAFILIGGFVFHVLPILLFLFFIIIAVVFIIDALKNYFKN